MEREVLGVLGGMGPLSSAEFLRTIYECTLDEREQDSPAVLMYSDPSFPDRTTAFLASEDDSVLGPLEAALRTLHAMGATRTVMCCMTVHHLLPRLPEELRERVVPLPELILRELLETAGRHLLVCSSGTRAFRLLERHPLWEEVADRVLLPDAADQAVIHRDLIYPMKRPADLDALAPILDRAMEKYGADGFIVGCSEVHILAKHLRARRGGVACIDPFLAVARGLAGAGTAPAAHRGLVASPTVG